MDVAVSYLNHIALPCSAESDPDDFYNEILGFVEKYRFSLDRETAWKLFGLYTEIPVIVLVKGELKIELFLVPFTEHVGLSHICLNCDDISGVSSKAEAKGYQVVSSERDSGKVAFIRDGSNNLIELKDIQSGHIKSPEK